MQPLTDSEILVLWERGARRHPLDRALLTLHAALAQTAGETLADWPLGRRNHALIELHCACFGTQLQGWLACEDCHEKLEFTLDGRALAQAGRDWRGGAPTEIAVGARTFRLPTSRDLAHVADAADSLDAARQLLDRCCVEPAASAAWSDAELDEIGDRMAQADPLAETQLALHCPACGADWHETFDIAAFLWTQIEARAKRLLWAIHALARAYGWSEAAILSLDENRRAFYLKMVRS
ncbi:hypothetical protein [Paraburkholderia fungorum]|uniref:hypothetical protein n=1 Tax=Paraburkholderia fungorum TaxID=134537 RepID=UPI0038B9717B